MLDFAEQHSPVVFYAADLDDHPRISYVSPNAMQVLGYEPRDLIEGDDFIKEHLHAADRDRYTPCPDVLEIHEPVTREFRLKMATGEYRWFRDTMRVLPDDSNGAPRLLGCLIDVTNEKSSGASSADGAGSHLHDILHDVLESLPSAMAVISAEGKMLVCNSEYASLYDSDPKSLLSSTAGQRAEILCSKLRSIDGKPVRSLDDLSKIQRQINAQSGGSVEVELQDGRWKLLTFGRTQTGERVHVRTDITDRKRVEKESERLHRMLDDALESLPNGFGLVDADGYLVRCNTAYAELYECRPAGMIGRSQAERSRQFLSKVRQFGGTPVTDVDADLPRWHQRLSRAHVDPVEVELKTGEWRLVTGNKTSDGGRAVIRTDISNLKRAEQERERLHGLLRDALESIPNDFAVLDKEGRLELCNSAYAALYGMDPRSLTETSREERSRAFVDKVAAIDGIPVQGGEETARKWRRLLFQSDGHSAEIEFKTGEWKLVCSSPMSDGGRTIIRTDLTKQKQIEAALRESEEHFRGIVEGHPLPVWMIDASSGDILYESSAARALIGEESARPEVSSIIDHFSQKDRLRHLKSLREHGEVRADALRARRGDGSEFWVEISSRLISHKGRDVVVSSLVDLTERKAAEAALRASEERFRNIVEGHPLPVSMIDINTAEILYESPAAAELMGRPWPAEEMQYSTSHFVNLEDREAFNLRLRETGKLRDFQWRFKKTDGTIFWAAVTESLMEFAGREVSIVSFVDLTEIKRREAELQQARETLEDAIESLPEGFALWDKEDRLVTCNARFREFNEVSADLLVPGVPWREFVRAGIDRGQYLDPAYTLQQWQKQRAKTGSLEFQQSNGRWYYAFTRPTRQGGDVLLRIDVTERKEMELALRDSEDMVRRVLEACPVPIQMSRVADGKILYESGSTKTLFGESADSDTQTSLSRYAEPGDRATYIAELRAHGSLDDYEVQYKRADGTSFTAAVSSRLIEYKGEDVIVCNIRDLTDTRAMEAEMSRQREALHQSEKLSALGELLASVAHELNNPLSVVVGQALLLKETASEKRIVDRATKIGNAADRCARIVKTFLSMARQDAGDKRTVDMNEVIETALEVTGYGLRASDIQVSLRLTPELPPIWGDADQLTQVLTNLVLNAQHALEEGRGPRTLRIVSRLRRGRVVVKVKDNGPGVPADIRSRIFEPLFTTKEVGTGTGIGLAVCHRVVEAHDGTFALEESSENGSTFTFTVPVAATTGSVDVEAAESSVSTSRLHALVVDDETEVAEMLADVLESDGHRVSIAHCGLAALDKIEVEEFDIVLSDLRMPDVDGPGLHDILAKKHPHLVARLAFITGDTMSPRVKRFLETAGRPYIEKPITPKEVRDIVRLVTAGAPNGANGSN